MGRREDTRQRLFDAATALIAERGYSATTVEDIAAAAGVAKGTVYYNFGSKPELFAELLRYGLGTLSRELRAAGGGLSGSGGVHAVATAQLRFIQRHQAFAQLLMAEMWHANRPWQPVLRALREEAVTAIAEVVRRGVDAGEFSDRVDARFAASALFGVVLAVALDWLVFSPEQSMEEVTGALLVIIEARLR